MNLQGSLAQLNLGTDKRAERWNRSFTSLRTIVEQTGSILTTLTIRQNVGEWEMRCRWIRKKWHAEIIKSKSILHKLEQDALVKLLSTGMSGSKIKTTIGGREYNIGDGGFVDWTQQLLENRKERMLISAIGLVRLLMP